MEREHRRDFRRPQIISALQHIAELAVQIGASSWREPLVEDLLIEGVQEGKAPGNRPVGPFGDAIGAENMALLGQFCARLLDVPASRFIPPATAAAENSTPIALATSSRRCSSGGRRSICRAIISRRSRGMPCCDEVFLRQTPDAVDRYDFAAINEIVDE